MPQAKRHAKSFLDWIPNSKAPLYINRARVTLPFLVRQAKAGMPIYYSDLAKEIGIKNPRNLDFILGSIGNTLTEFGERHKLSIPAIQCLVINQKDDLPGEGIGSLLSPEAFSNLSKAEKQAVWDLQFARIRVFSKWDWILNCLNLEPITINRNNEFNEIRNWKSGGESEFHRAFKDFIFKNPHAIGLDKSLGGTMEHCLLSGDRLDILFENKEQLIGVEVKSKISNAADILRGIYQCIKYKSVLEAMQIASNKIPNCRVILALEGQLPKSYLIEQNLFNIEIYDKINL